MRKGVFGAFVMLMIVTVVFLLGAGWGMIMYSNGLSDTLYINMNDLNSISEADTYGDYFNNDFTPRILNLSETRAAYNLGTEGAGLTWSRGTVPFNNPKTAAAEELRVEMEPMLEDYFVSAASTIRCDIESDYGLEVSAENKRLSGNKPNITCSATDTVSATYGLETEFVSDHRTRFLKMVEDMNELAENTKEELPEDKQSDTGSATVCGDQTLSIASAKSNARSNTVDDYSDAPDTAVSETELHPDFEIIEDDIFFSPGASDADVIAGPEDNGDCNCDYDENGTKIDGSCSTDWYTEADYTLEEIDVNYVLRDARQKFLTDDGAQHINLEITYNHPLG